MSANAVKAASLNSPKKERPATAGEKAL
jgi:hypothetical protein